MIILFHLAIFLWVWLKIARYLVCLVETNRIDFWIFLIIAVALAFSGWQAMEFLNGVETHSGLGEHLKDLWGRYTLLPLLIGAFGITYFTNRRLKVIQGSPEKDS